MQPAVVTAAYAASVLALVAVLGTPLTSRSRPWKGRWRPIWPAPGR